MWATTPANNHHVNSVLGLAHSCMQKQHWEQKAYHLTLVCEPQMAAMQMT